VVSTNSSIYLESMVRTVKLLPLPVWLAGAKWIAPQRCWGVSRRHRCPRCGRTYGFGNSYHGPGGEWNCRARNFFRRANLL